VTLSLREIRQRVGWGIDRIQGAVADFTGFTDLAPSGDATSALRHLVEARDALTEMIEAEEIPPPPADHPVEYDVDSSDDVQAFIDNEATEGQEITFAPEVYEGVEIRVREGQTYHAPDGAVLDGLFTADFAFDGHHRGNDPVDGWKVWGPWEIRHYMAINNSQEGAIRARRHHGTIETAFTREVEVDGRDGVVDVHDCYGRGLSMGDEFAARRVHLHRNTGVGIGGGRNNPLFEHFEVDHNSLPLDVPELQAALADEMARHPGRVRVDEETGLLRIKSGWEGGGSKWSKTDGLIVRHGKCHHNGGPGLWPDIDNVRWLIEDVECWADEGESIKIEISFEGVLRRFHVHDSGTRPRNWVWGAAVLIQDSGGVEVYDGLVERCQVGVAMTYQRRDDETDRYQTRDNYVHDVEVVDCDRIYAGAVQDKSDPRIFEEWNNRYDRMTYRVRADQGRPFAWENGSRTWEEWRAAGHDADGSMATIPQG